MKTARFLTLITAVALMALGACKPDPLAHFTDNVKVTTAEPAFITGSTASCGAEVTADNEGLLIELGVCWSLNEKPTTDDNTLRTNRCSQPFSCLLSQLQPNTSYHIRAYARYGTEYVYGEEKIFSTLGSDAPAVSPVTTLEATEITYCTFKAGAKVEPFGVSHFTVGICYSTRPEFTIEDCEGSEPAYYNEETGNYEMMYCENLSPSTQYYYRAVVAYDDGDGLYNDFFYGEILSFTTTEVPFILNLYTDYHNYSSYGQYVYVAGNGFCTQPKLINQVGFCYSIANEYPEYESDLHTTAATPTGEYFDFGSYIYNLSANKRYYIRSYARYKVDSIKYGNVIYFDTY